MLADKLMVQYRISVNGMSYCDPPVEHRFTKDNQPFNSGRPKTAWIKKILNEKNPEGQEKREQIVRHMITVATSVSIIHAGKDLEFASARDAVEAAKLLLAYDVGLPPKAERMISPVTVDGSKSLLDVAMDIYKSRLEAGEMSEGELSEMVRVLLAAEREKALLFLKALGPKLQAMQSEKIDRLLVDYEADPNKFLGFNKEPKKEGAALPKLEGLGESSLDGEPNAG